MNKYLSLTLAITFCLSSGFSSGQDASKQLITSHNAFAMSLYNALGSHQNESSNLVFSPYSISSCLHMTHLGARSETAEEMAKTLHITTPAKEILHPYQQLSEHLLSRPDRNRHPDKGYEFHIANSLWVEKNTFICPDYLCLLQEHFGAAFQQLDFMHPKLAIDTVNDWVAHNTQGKINALLGEQDVDKTTKLLLVNTAYFKGSFAHPFLETRTEQTPFFSAPSSSVLVPTMHQVAHLPYLDHPHFQLLAHPFVNNSDSNAHMAFFVILPKEGTDIQDTESLLLSNEWVELLDDLQPQRVEVFLPKFTLRHRLDLGKTLEKMGMVKAFDPKEADFSGIDGKRDLYVNKGIHETFFALDEKGVTAAAATAISMNITSCLEPKDPIVFRADHPFLFGICDLNTKSLLFLGKLTCITE